MLLGEVKREAPIRTEPHPPRSFALPCRGIDPGLTRFSAFPGPSGPGVWTFQRLTRCRCVPEGRLESRPAIYRRYWRLEFDLVPEGRSKLGLAHGRYILFASRKNMSAF